MPKYEPNKWNKDLFTRESHNCYSYFLNKISKKSISKCKKKIKSQKYKKVPMKIKISEQLPCSPCERPQPGFLSNEKLSDEKLYKNITCKKITKKVLKDNKKIKLKPKNTRKCPRNYYEGILIVYPNKDYHFIRVDKDGKMSHKDGVQKVSRYITTYKNNKNNKSNNSNKIKKYKLNRKNLKIYEKLGGKICQSFCVPDVPNKLKYKTKFFKNNDCPVTKNKININKEKIGNNKRLYYYFKYLEDPKKYKNNKYLKGFIF